MMMVATLFALCLRSALAKEVETCKSLNNDGLGVSGEVLLQKSKQMLTLSEPSELPFASEMSLAQPYESPPSSLLPRSCGKLTDDYQGAPKCMSQEQISAQEQTQALFANFQMLNGGGTDASLDDAGFKETTLMCCPMEMEIFFNRLLDSKGYDMCSLPHLQGLMHWFTCVPDMDFQYVLQIIQDGNPCKYWSPKGKACPALSTKCAGQWCSKQGPAPEAPTKKAPKTDDKGIQATTTKAPKTEAPATEAPTTEAPTTEAATTPHPGWCTKDCGEVDCELRIADALAPTKCIHCTESACKSYPKWSIKIAYDEEACTKCKYCLDQPGNTNPDWQTKMDRCAQYWK